MLLWTWGAGISETPLPVLSGADPEVGSPGHMVVVFNYLRTLHTVPTAAAPFHVPSVCTGFHFSTSSVALVSGALVSAIPVGVWWPHCGRCPPLPRAWGGEHLVMGSLAVLESVRLFKSFAYFLNWVCFRSSLYILDFNPSSDI